jgi:hypothetical protein
MFATIRCPFGWRGIAFVAVCIIAPPAKGDEEASSAERLATMRKRVESLKLKSFKDGAEIARIDRPILRYSDAGGITTDATIWAWGKEGRPAALATIFFLQEDDGRTKWSCELLSLADEPLILTGSAGWSWSPQQAGLRWQPLTGPAPADDEKSRARQMKDLAGDFAASETFSPTQTTQLRLMIRPLHSYADEKRGIVDGSLFAFATGTNPEVMLIVECRKADDGSLAWYFAGARMGAAQAELRHNDKVVWSCKGIDNWDRKSAYYSHFGSDAYVFNVTEE